MRFEAVLYITADGDVVKAKHTDQAYQRGADSMVRTVSGATAIRCDCADTKPGRRRMLLARARALEMDIASGVIGRVLHRWLGSEASYTAERPTNIELAILADRLEDIGRADDAEVIRLALVGPRRRMRWELTSGQHPRFSVHQDGAMVRVVADTRWDGSNAVQGTFRGQVIDCTDQRCIVEAEPSAFYQYPTDFRGSHLPIGYFIGVVCVWPADEV